MEPKLKETSPNPTATVLEKMQLELEEMLSGDDNVEFTLKLPLGDAGLEISSVIGILQNGKAFDPDDLEQRLRTAHKQFGDIKKNTYKHILEEFCETSRAIVRQAIKEIHQPREASLRESQYSAPKADRLEPTL